MGVMIFNVHCLGWLEMMRAAKEAAREANARTRLSGVTILTSHDRCAVATHRIGSKSRAMPCVFGAAGAEAGLMA
jgi:orotidine-5'-phosphate decarboxylase